MKDIKELYYEMMDLMAQIEECEGELLEDKTKIEKSLNSSDVSSELEKDNEFVDSVFELEGAKKKIKLLPRNMSIAFFITVLLNMYGGLLPIEVIISFFPPIVVLLLATDNIAEYIHKIMRIKVFYGDKKKYQQFLDKKTTLSKLTIKELSNQVSLQGWYDTRKRIVTNEAKLTQEKKKLDEATKKFIQALEHDQKAMLKQEGIKDDIKISTAEINIEGRNLLQLTYRKGDKHE